MGFIYFFLENIQNPKKLVNNSISMVKFDILNRTIKAY